MFSKHLGGHGLFGPPWLRLCLQLQPAGQIRTAKLFHPAREAIFQTTAHEPKAIFQTTAHEPNLVREYIL